jgi:hypothetical protein
MEHQTFLELTEIDSKVPEAPGIYVWYVKPLIGRTDWVSSFDALGNDKGDENLRQILFEFSNNLAPPKLTASAKLAFRDSWQGVLKAESYDSNSKKILKAGHESDYHFPGELFDTVLRSEKSRFALTEFITRSFINFWTPIYVGKSKNLRGRLNKHVSNYRKLYDSARQDPKVNERIKVSIESDDPENTPTLATRLLYANIKPAQCSIAFLETSYAGCEENDAVQLAEVLEWLLNTWNRPILGKN